MPKGKALTSKDSALPANKAAAFATRKDGWNAFFDGVASGWNNPHTGVGVGGTDRRLSTSFAPKLMLPEGVLRSMYRGDGLGKRIIELPIETMFRQGFTVDGDPDGMIVARMEETGILAELENLIRWGNLYGGALGVLGVDDGQRYEMPLREENVRNVHYLHTFNRWRVTWTTSDLYTDNRHPKYGTPQFYRITPLFGTPFKVHESRTIKVDGNPVDDLTRFQNQGWGDSILQSCFDELRQLASVFDSGESIIEDFVTAVLGLKGLADLIAGGQEKVAIKRLEILDKARHVTNTNMIDAELETYTKVASSVAGLSDLMDRYMNKLAAVTGIPVTLLMGMAPAGLNATGDSDVRNWYDRVQSQQKKSLRPPVERIARLMFLSSDYYFDGKEPENWKVQFTKLWQPTEKEEAELEDKKVDTVVKLISNGVMDPNEARDLPQIRDRYNLIGDVPAKPPDPFLIAAGIIDAQGNPILGGGTDDEEDETGGEGGDNLPPLKKPEGKKETNEDSEPPPPAVPPEIAKAEIMGACRSQVFDARGRRRGDSASFHEKTVTLSRRVFRTTKDAAKWALDHGFKADRLESTLSTYRFPQRDRTDFVPLTERTISPAEGIEVTLGRLLGN